MGIPLITGTPPVVMTGMCAWLLVGSAGQGIICGPGACNRGFPMPKGKAALELASAVEGRLCRGKRMERCKGDCQSI